MNIQPLKIEQIRAELKRQGYRHVGLFTQEGDKIIAFNNAKMPVLERLKEIETRLKSPTLPNGLYYIHAKSGISANTVPDKFPILKGRFTSEKPQSVIIHGPETLASEDLYTPAQYMQLRRDLIDSQLYAEQLERQIELANERITELESTQLNDGGTGETTVWDRAQTFLSELLPTVTPMIDKLLDQRDKKLALQALQYQHMLPGSNRPQKQPPRQVRPAPQPTQQDDAQEFIQAYAMEYGEQDPIVQQLIECYNTAADLNDFLMKINQIQVMDEDEQPIQLADMFNEYVSQEYGPDDEE